MIESKIHGEKKVVSSLNKRTPDQKYGIFLERLNLRGRVNERKERLGFKRTRLREFRVWRERDSFWVKPERAGTRESLLKWKFESEIV